MKQKRMKAIRYIRLIHDKKRVWALLCALACNYPTYVIECCKHVIGPPSGGNEWQPMTGENEK